MSKLLFTIAFFGLLVSGYLFATYTSPIPLVCGKGGGCHTVQASEYASFFGIPTPAYGILFYACLAVGAAIWDPNQKTSSAYSFLALLTLSGLVVSGWLTYLEAFVIEAWCRWCVVSAVLSLLAFLLVWIHPRYQWLSHQTQKSE